MYEHLRGRLTLKGPTEIVMDVGGVGFRLEVSLRTSEQLPPAGTDVTVLVHYKLSEDRARLFGFAEEEERALFRHLLSVAGIGPSHTLNLLSGNAPGEVWRLISEGNWKTLAVTRGIGPKIAQRACTELRDRALRQALSVGTASPSSPRPQSPHVEDAVASLLVLGFTEPQARKAVEKAATATPAASVADLVRDALKSSA